MEKAAALVLAEVNSSMATKMHGCSLSCITC